ncbi:MAG: hypothetical protein JXM71_08430 [Spirochaetales bacterium]|nr:hypothetical protein [Spirochaetales bacterium]
MNGHEAAHAQLEPLRGQSSRIHLERCSGAAVFELYDRSVRALPFLSGNEASTLIVAGDEILDNLLTHGEIGPGGVCVVVRKRTSALSLAFFVESHEQFAAFAERASREPRLPPRFDEREGRWRGLGLTMCANLAVQGISYRPGTLVDRIFLRFQASR